MKKTLPGPIQSLLFIALLAITPGCDQRFESKSTTEVQPAPNVILLLTDDMGYGDLSCYGGQAVYTPNIDQLARLGTRFTRFYSASAVCSPSRAAILTGQYPLRFNITRHFSDNEEHLPEGAITLPKLLKKAGYATAHIGKWHLGGLRELDYAKRNSGEKANPGPLQQGFDHYLCNIEGDPPRPMLISEKKLYREGGKYLVCNDQRAAPRPEHWTDIKIAEAISLLETWNVKKQRFFLNIWFDVPHTPYEPAPEPHLSKYEKMGATGDQLYFRSMVSNLDAQIGRLVEKLHELGLTKNTLILFTSDNGAAWEGEVGPFKGGKTDLHEGGIRVPFFAVWPGMITGGLVSFQRGHHIDILPTLCEAAGIDVTDLQLDGISLLPQLMGDAAVERGTLFWQMDLYRSLQRHYAKPEPFATGIAYRGPWKLLLDSIRPVELFHLENDPHEVMNLIHEYPEIVNEFSKDLLGFYGAPRYSHDH